MKASYLIRERHVDEISSNRAFPITAVTRRPASIEQDHYVTAVRHPLIDHVTIGLRQDLFVTWARVNVENDRIMIALFEIAWPNECRVHRPPTFRAQQFDLRQR